MSGPLTLRELVMHYNLYKRLVADHQRLIEGYEEYSHIAKVPQLKVTLATIVASQKNMQTEMLKLMKTSREAIDQISAAWNQIHGGNYGP